MSWRIVFLVFFGLAAFILIPIFFLLYYQYRSFATPIKANIVIDLRKTIGPVPGRWKALAQGGEEKGVRMLENVIPQVSALYPRYIRLDHIYDFYDVVGKDSQNNLTFNWQKLDETVCDIYHTGAKPFFSLGYMPGALSQDGSLISAPSNWNEWALVVQKTIEHYSGTQTRLCGQIGGSWFSDIYYEVWNEPDLESFGKWSIYPGTKSYQTLYQYSALGASNAQNVNKFLLGGPVTTSLYRNWIYYFLEFAMNNNLRVDFISWHHYSTNPQDYSRQIGEINGWLSDPRFARFKNVPLVISEWGYDSNPNPIADTNVGAAHTISSIRNFFEQNIEAAFLFEVKDGVSPSWGVLSHDGTEKPRYKALRLLNLLEGTELFIEGEGTFVQALAATANNTTRVILVNYDQNESNNELVPVKFVGLTSGEYTMTTTYLDGRTIPVRKIPIQGNELSRQVIMPPNMVVAIELKKE